MKNRDYWKNRFEQIENNSNKKALNLLKEIEKEYKKAQIEIENKINIWYQRFAINNKITMAQGKKLLNSKELKEFKWNVYDYIKYGKENSINNKWIKELENASAKFHITRLKSLKLQIQNSIEVLFSKQLENVNNSMKDIYKESYYRSIFEVQKGFKIIFNIDKINNSKLKSIMLKPWALDEKNFSERIWQNKNKLINELYSELMQMAIRGSSPNKAIENIAKKFNVSNKNSRRLVMTESSYFSSIAQKEAFCELDIKKYEIVATLDTKTSEICSELDGKTFDMKDYQVGITSPPFHVNCRSVTAPYFEDNYTTRIGRDKESKIFYLDSNITYKEWFKKYIAS